RLARQEDERSLRKGRPDGLRVFDRPSLLDRARRVGFRAVKVAPTELDERPERKTAPGLVMRETADLCQESLRALGRLVPETCDVAIGDESAALRETGVPAVSEMLRKPNGLFPARL